MAGVLLYFLLTCLSWSVYLFFLLVFTAVAVYVAREAEVVFYQKDPPCIVIDEVTGLLWTMLFVSPAIPAVVTGFILFRFFDIVKPFPVRLLEDKFPGGYGVVGDDVMAGIYSNITLQVLIKFSVI